MSAGTGVIHSEFNNAPDRELHFLQIWIEPEARGIAPGYEQKAFPAEQRQGEWRLVVSRQGRDGSVSINQDVNLYVGLFAAGERVPTPEVRHAWLHLVRGEAEINGQRLSAGDAAAFQPGEAIEAVGAKDAELLLFDLA